MTNTTSAAKGGNDDEQWIFDLAAEHERHRSNGLYGPVTFDASGLLDFARAIVAHAAAIPLLTAPAPQTDEWDIPSERMLFETAFPEAEEEWSIEADQVAWKVWQKARATAAAPQQSETLGELSDKRIIEICDKEGLGPRLGLAVGRAIEREVLASQAAKQVGELSAVRDQALMEAMRACEGERVEDTGSSGDTAYNMAIMHCMGAIEGLRTQSTASKESGE